MISQQASIIRSVVLIAIVAMAAAGCSANPTSAANTRSKGESVSGPSQGSGIGDRAASVALQQLGVPYQYGGSTPDGFDCSGLVHYSYARAGKNIPRTTAGQWTNLSPVDHRQIRAGDLLFFNISGKMSHVGLYLGGGRFVHAPSSGKVVAVESLGSDFYSRAFIRAGRPR
jgi:cell wall-associated NlpC family hydrolase